MRFCPFGPMGEFVSGISLQITINIVQFILMAQKMTAFAPTF
jgi:hypothetical protein